MSTFSLDAIWHALGRAHDGPDPGPSAFGPAAAPGQAWTRLPGPAGFGDGGFFGGGTFMRVWRLRHAVEDSLPLAMERLQQLLGAISLAQVRQVLVTLVRDIAVVWCGSVLLGSGAGAALGALGFGVGAIPGAALGAEVGAAAGEALLAMLGLKALAESMVSSMPRALRAWQRGARDAWDDPPFHDPHDGHDAFRVRQAASELAEGHLALLQALLAALLAWLARGGAARALALHEISGNARLGPAVARWIEEQEIPLREALARAGRRSEAERVGVPARTGAPAVTPAQLRAEAQATNSTEARPPNIAANQQAVAALGIPNRLSPRQDLHIPPVTDGRSVLTADPKDLLQGLVDGYYPILRTPKTGQAIVDFGQPIGEFWTQRTGVPQSAGPTNYGSVVFGKNGTHIVPANPSQW